jgi:hypothetical protein
MRPVIDTAASRRASLVVGLIPLGLYVLAVAVRLGVAAEVPFPTTEVSAYFVGVAQSLLAGDGLVSDAVWSYATPPLEVPKAAFDIWLPMASLVAAAAMGPLGATFDSAQVAGALMGALVAPLVWGLAREAGRVQGLDRRRAGSVALASGLIAAILSPFVISSVVPDSYTPFTVFMLLAALLLPRVLGIRDGLGTDPPRRPVTGAGLGLGIAMGLAYLSRQEVIWFGLTVVLMLAWVLRGHEGGTRLREASARLWPVVAGGLLVVTPWLLRNLIEFGSPMPGQAVENMFLGRNEDIFAFLDRPDLSTYLSQGLATILSNPVTAAIDGFVNVLALPAFPIGLAGLLALMVMWRAPAVRRPTALAALLSSGAIIFVSTVLLFPVASLWGTFAHSSGPLLAALVVMAALGGDVALARISAIRRWERPNVIVAPVALLAVVVVLGMLQFALVIEQSRGTERRYATLTEALSQVQVDLGAPMPDTIITDHPMWLADALGRAAIALPDEPPNSIRLLGAIFDAPWVVVIDERGRYPGALLTDVARSCLTHDPRPLSAGDSPAWLFILADSCVGA